MSRHIDETVHSEDLSPRSAQWAGAVLAVCLVAVGCHWGAAGTDAQSEGDMLATDGPRPDSGGDLLAPTGDGGNAATVDADQPYACNSAASSSLPDVWIGFAPQTWTYSLAQVKAGINIAYEVVIANQIEVVPLPQDAGACGIPGGSGLIVFERLVGGGHSYCLCDRGKCGPPAQTPVTLRPGTYSGEFTWDGVNWGGPSDTGLAKGPPFPPGEHRLTVSAIGTHGASKTPFEVKASCSLRLTP